MLFFECNRRYSNKLMKHLSICVKLNVKHHQNILRLVEQIEELLHIFLLFQFMSYLVSLCVGIYQTSMVFIFLTHMNV